MSSTNHKYTKEEALLDAIACWDIKTAMSIIQSGCDVHWQTDRGDTALHFAAQQGLLDVTQLLVEAGVDVDIQNHHGHTPLIYAAAESDNAYDAILYLLSEGADVNHADKHGFTALHNVAAHGFCHRKAIPMAKILLNQVEYLKAHAHGMGLTPLHCANGIAMIRLLLQHGADPLALTHCGKTPTQWMDFNRDFHIAGFLQAWINMQSTSKNPR